MCEDIAHTSLRYRPASAAIKWLGSLGWAFIQASMFSKYQIRAVRGGYYYDFRKQQRPGRALVYVVGNRAQEHVRLLVYNTVNTYNCLRYLKRYNH